MTTDSAFAGSIPAIYDECLVPVLFEPFARDIVARAAALAPARVLEIAAGTGVVSRALAEALPSAEIVATDLNPAMLAVAEARGVPANLRYQPADAQDLPFAEGSFDLALAQFGAMFFPDKRGAYAEAARVLARSGEKGGGTWLFNVWDALGANPGSEAVHRAVGQVTGDPAPQFLARTPYGHSDAAAIEADLRAAGFTAVTVERVAFTSPPGSAERLARGLVLGSPLAAELAAHPAGTTERALAAATEAAQAVERAQGGLAMSALVVTAQA